MRAHLPIAAVVAASLVAAACSDTSTPLAPRPAVSFGKGGPTPSGPNALPQRGPIVFQMYDGVSGSDLYSVNEDGSGLKRLTYSPYDDKWPAASRDGRKIAYVAARDDAGTAADIVVMNADGSQPKVITKSGLDIDAFSRMDWSPDGKRIAIALQTGPSLLERDIYLVNVSTGSMTQVTSFPGEEEFPSWSPDGRRLAFDMADGNGMKQIFTMNPDGSDLIAFTYCVTHCVEPSWSPDGAKIAYYDLYAETTTVSSASQWGNVAGSFPGKFAAWAPDAARLAFQSRDPAMYGALATVSFDGINVQKILDGNSGQGVVTWLRK